MSKVFVIWRHTTYVNICRDSKNFLNDKNVKKIFSKMLTIFLNNNFMDTMDHHLYFTMHNMIKTSIDNCDIALLLGWIAVSNWRLACRCAKKKHLKKNRVALKIVFIYNNILALPSLFQYPTPRWRLYKHTPTR